jgi:hypothetical protein
VIAGSGLVEQQPRRPAVVRDEHVDVAVIVDVAERGAAADLRELQRGASLAGHVAKPAAADVPE